MRNAKLANYEKNGKAIVTEDVIPTLINDLEDGSRVNTLEGAIVTLNNNLANKQDKNVGVQNYRNVMKVNEYGNLIPESISEIFELADYQWQQLLSGNTLIISSLDSWRYNRVGVEILEIRVPTLNDIAFIANRTKVKYNEEYSYYFELKENDMTVVCNLYFKYYSQDQYGNPYYEATLIPEGVIALPFTTQEMEDICDDIFYPALPAPQNVEVVNDTTIQFDNVQGAEAYIVYANGNEIGEVQA